MSISETKQKYLLYKLREAKAQMDSMEAFALVKGARLFTLEFDSDEIDELLRLMESSD